MYEGLLPGAHVYRLRSLVCYYGAHHQAFVLVPEAGSAGSWVMVDGARATRIGTWADVRRKCVSGRIMPTLLFFEAPH